MNSHLQVVMDVDETMLAVRQHTYSDVYDGTFTLDEKTFSYRLRPGIQTFLLEVSHVADLHIFTTEQASYAYAIRTILDPTHTLFHNVWTFEHSHSQVIAASCCRHSYTRAKSLSMCFGTSFDPRRTVLIDDCLDYHALNPRNGILIKPFSQHPRDHNDRELDDLLPWIKDVLVPAKDVRPHLHAEYSLESRLGTVERHYFHSLQQHER